MLVPIYIAETAPTRLRGMLGATNQLAVTLGLVVVRTRPRGPVCLVSNALRSAK